MCRTATDNNALPSEGAISPRRRRFTLTDLLTFATALPVCIGVIEAVEFTAFNQSFEWFGIDWHSDVRHFLVDKVGVPSDFVAGYVTFAMTDLPAWVCYSMIALFLGLLRSKWSFPAGVAFIVAIFVRDLMSDYFSGLHGFVNLRLVSLFGVVVAALCFASTRRIRSTSHFPNRKPGRLTTAFTCLAIVALLAASAYGWWLVDLDYKAGIEVQRTFGSLIPK